MTGWGSWTARRPTRAILVDAAQLVVTWTAVSTATGYTVHCGRHLDASGDGTGETIQFTVTFDQDVTVTGTPEFEFCLGNSDGGSCTDGSPSPARRRAAVERLGHDGAGVQLHGRGRRHGRQLPGTVECARGPHGPSRRRARHE